FSMCPLPPRSSLFPYTTLFRSGGDSNRRGEFRSTKSQQGRARPSGFSANVFGVGVICIRRERQPRCSCRCWEFGSAAQRAFWKKDRKSTRLNSSHVKISYAVFC